MSISLSLSLVHFIDLRLLRLDLVDRTMLLMHLMHTTGARLVWLRQCCVVVIMRALPLFALAAEEE